MKFLAAAEIAILFTLSLCGEAFANKPAPSISLTWNPNSEQDIAGYLVESGTASGVYTSEIDVQNATSTAISDLVDGVEYYFVVKAYNTAGLISPPSAEVSGIAGGNGKGKGKRLGNVSTRVPVYQGDSVMIVGFIVSGDTDKAVALRGIGPSLFDAGVKGSLADPLLELYDSTGASIGQNDDWTSLPAESIPAGLQPSEPTESLITATLSPGSYTAVLRGANGSTGVALCELYDLDEAGSSILNVSTRAQVGIGDDVLIGGFIILGEEATQVIVRAIGPSLTVHGVSGALSDPILELHSQDGSLISENDDWRSNQEQQIIDTTIPPTDDRESAIVATLPPGGYTAVVRGAGNGTGVALVEAYDLENP